MMKLRKDDFTFEHLVEELCGNPSIDRNFSQLVAPFTESFNGDFENRKIFKHKN